MRRFLFLFCIVILSIPHIVLSQRDSLRNVFLDAESWFLFEEYVEALPLYEGLLENDPGNDNLKYRIGICLLNDPYQKDKSIEYLLDASDNINPDYKENSFKESTAPPDVLYYLGDAYLVNELLDLAIETYHRFLRIMDRDVYDEELVRTQIQACENAKRLKTMPVDIDLYLLDSLINTRYSDLNPVISGDGTKLAFVTELPFYDGAFFCEKTDEGWSYPQAITQSLGFDADIYPVSLSYDGTEMILYYDDEYIGNLYYSKYEDGRWLPATKMGDNISTKFWESHGSFSKDGQTLYFTSNRKGGNGGLDIYQSKRQPDGEWGVPENLGPVINSRYNEETPFITEDGQTLYFSSYGHYNMGGYDIFYSKKNADGTWAEPINLGYPINTTDDDLFFQPANNGMRAYYSLYSPSGRGRHDIYHMDIYSIDNPRMYLVAGNLRTEDGIIDPSRMTIYVVDSETGDTVAYTQPERVSGAFSFQLKQGIYELHFTGEGYDDLIRPLQITRNTDKEGIRLGEDIELALIREEPVIFEGEESMVYMEDSLYEAPDGEPITVPLRRLRRGSVLISRIYQDSVLVSTDTIEIDRRRFDLEIEPLPGSSTYELELIDPDGNIHKQSFEVEGETPVEDLDIVDTIAQVVEEGLEEIALQEQLDVVLPTQERTMGEVVTSLQDQTEGALQELLVDLDPEQEEIGNRTELFEHLYTESDTQGYTREEVDRLLTREVSGGDAGLLQQRMVEQSEGPLKEYLEQLDLEAEGIETPDQLLDHLREVAVENEFTDEEIRESLMLSLQQIEKEEDPVEILKQKLIKDSDGAIHEVLERLDPEQEGITSQSELIEFLYAHSDSLEYDSKEVDQLLTGIVSEGDLPLFYQHLLESSEGPLKEYLEQLDLEAEGIESAEALREHLMDVASAEGFNANQVKQVMLNSLESPLEVDQLVSKLVEDLEAGPVKEILEDLELRQESIYTTEDLIVALYQDLRDTGYSPRETEKMLAEVFDSHSDFLSDLRKKEGKKTWPILVICLGGAALLLIILFWRRRGKNKEDTAP